MQPQYKNKFGRVDLNVSAFGFGTAPVGNIFREIDEKTSDDMFQAAWNAGIRFFDTAPMYGHGLSEYRTGYSLRWKNRDDFILSTKVVDCCTLQRKRQSSMRLGQMRAGSKSSLTTLMTQRCVRRR